MDKLMVENFRCFGAEQTARLAPLTLLVGENSTGKTSFMALASILWDAVYEGNYLPSFKNDPFDLGAFQDIVHECGDKPKIEFSGGFGIKGWTCKATFQKGTSGPEVVGLRIKDDTGSVTWDRSTEGHITVSVRTERGKWHASANPASKKHDSRTRRRHLQEDWGPPSIHNFVEANELRPALGFFDLAQEDKRIISAIANVLYDDDDDKAHRSPMAMAPIRSHPERTYEQGYPSLDPKNERIPQHLAALYSGHDCSKQWTEMKQALDGYGRTTGLFEEIDVRPLGENPDSDPFQLQFKVHDGSGGSSWRNIVDVGYGVSQFLPVIIELIKGDHPLLLLQQPEVHLHPSAQAGLGSILCTIANPHRQILVETHSDYLIDRVCREVRDQEKTQLKPDDVSILYFERTGPGVKIHDIRIDEEGNICDAPPSYRQFFMEEIDRNLGFT